MPNPALHLSAVNKDVPVCRPNFPSRNYKLTDKREDVTCNTCKNTIWYVFGSGMII